MSWFETMWNELGCDHQQSSNPTYYNSLIEKIKIETVTEADINFLRTKIFDDRFNTMDSDSKTHTQEDCDVFVASFIAIHSLGYIAMYCMPAKPYAVSLLAEALNHRWSSQRNSVISTIYHSKLTELLPVLLKRTEVEVTNKLELSTTINYLNKIEYKCKYPNSWLFTLLDKPHRSGEGSVPEQIHEKAQELGITDEEIKFIADKVLYSNGRSEVIIALRTLGILAEDFPDRTQLILPALLYSLTHTKPFVRYYGTKAIWQGKLIQAKPALETALISESDTEVIEIMTRAIAVLNN